MILQVCLLCHPDIILFLIFPIGFAMDRYAYYVCFKCGKAYFGGEARCDLEAGAGDSFNPEELVCGGCSDVSQVRLIPQYQSQDPDRLTLS